jgi:hypothetical protein
MTIRAGKLLQGLVSLGLIVWLLWFIYNNWAMFESVARIAPAHIAGMAAFILISWYVNSLQSLILLRLERMQVGLWENLVVQTGSEITCQLERAPSYALPTSSGVTSLNIRALGDSSPCACCS